MNKLIAATALAAGLLASAAQASTVTQTKNFVSTAGINLNFNAFDPTLGTFTGATIEVSGTGSIAAGSIVGGTADPGDGARFSGGVDVEFELLRNGSLAKTFRNGPTANCEDRFECEASYRTSNVKFNLSASSTDASEFDSPFSFRLETTTDPFATIGFVAFEQTTNWSSTGTATLTYTFEPTAVVPLPASLPLALGGIALLGAVARRRKS